MISQDAYLPIFAPSINVIWLSMRQSGWAVRLCR